MNKLWTDDGWADYLYWQSQDKKTLKRINELIKDIERNGVLNGIGKRNIEKDLVEELTKLTGLSKWSFMDNFL